MPTRQKREKGRTGRKASAGSGKRDSTAELLTPKGRLIKASDGVSKYINHPFVVTKSAFSVQGNVLSTLYGGIPVLFSDIPNYTLYTALFDQFRIDVVEVTVNLRSNPAAGALFPRLNIFPDFDDAAAPSTLANVQGHPRCMTHVFTEAKPRFTFSFVPKVAVAAYGGAFTQYSSPNDRPVFVDCNSPATSHYGYKYAIENFTDTTQYVEFVYRIWFTMRSPL